jgi:serpin B
VDFREGPAVRKRINDWVLSKTRDKIRDLIPEGLPTADTRLALVNAIHFLAQWEEAFSERATEEKPFTNAKGEKVPVPMMRRTDHYRYADDGRAQVLAIPYRGHAAEMVLVLPKDPAGLAEVERGLTPAAVSGWMAGRGFQKVALSLPRFRFEAPTDLGAHLAALGMGDAFDPAKADFRGMADVKDQPLFIGAVLHKAFIAVDEKGTEAAAATAVLMRAGSAPRPEEPIPFVCDRPFLFFLRHVATGALLFVGRYSMP